MGFVLFPSEMMVIKEDMTHAAMINQIAEAQL